MAETPAPVEAMDPGGDNDVEKEGMAGPLRDRRTDHVA